jgi:hypothetical protein
VSGAPGRIFDGLKFSFDDGSQFYDVDSPDVLAAMSGSQIALNYANDSGGAGLQVVGTGGRGSVVVFGFPFETIRTAAQRADVVRRVLDFFQSAARPSKNAQ